jgi:uncharacterized protein
MVPLWNGRAPGTVDAIPPLGVTKLRQAETIPVTFENREGFRLFGILHQPERPLSDVAVLLLSPGVKMRVAPHRMYKAMAERFTQLGYPVLRFDFYGLGDSEGEVDEKLLADLYGSIQAGRYVGDTIAAMDWMERTHGISRFVVSGLCGGALTGLLAGQRDPRIIGLMGLAIPVILDGSSIDFTKYMTDTQLAGRRRGYLSKLRLWDGHVWRSWLRFFTGQSHYSLILRSTLRPLLKIGGPKPAASTIAPMDNTNPLFAPAFRQMVSSGRKVLLVFAETDRLTWEYDAKFRQRHAAWLDSFAAWHERHVTSDSNHIFSLHDWQQDMLERCCGWLKQLGVDGMAPVELTPGQLGGIGLQPDAHR